MLRAVSCSPSLSSASLFFRFFRQFPRSYLSSSDAFRASSRSIRRTSSPSVAGRRLLLRRELRTPSAVGRGVNRQFSSLSVRAVATQPAQSYPGVGGIHLGV